MLWLLIPICIAVVVAAAIIDWRQKYDSQRNVKPAPRILHGIPWGHGSSMAGGGIPSRSADIYPVAFESLFDEERSSSRARFEALVEELERKEEERKEGEKK
jgi:hypothetical protein